VLHRTLGVPLFQEQALRIAIVAAGFPPAEADKLRRAMATFKRVGTITYFRDKMVNGMVAKGYRREFAERCFSQIEGFGEYGFPESHAASFANLVYASAWIKCRYPDVFAAALLNSQPMGFYAPAQIVRDAQDHGVEIRPVDVNFSCWDCTLEKTVAVPGPLPRWRGGVQAREARRQGAAALHPRHADMSDDIRTTRAVRLGFRQISGASEDQWKIIEQVRGNAACSIPPPLAGEGGRQSRPGGGKRIAAAKPHPAAHEARSHPPLSGKGWERAAPLAQNLPSRRETKFDSIRDFWLRTRLPPSALERLAAADAFRSLGLDRRAALWAVRALRRTGDKDDLPLFASVAMPELEADAALPPMPLGEQVVADYRHLHLSLKAHPVSFLRGEIERRGIVRHERLGALPSGRIVTVAGLVLVRQRPGSAQGVIFMTLEDETGIANTIVWPKVFEIFRPVVLGARLISVTGKLQNEQNVIHVVAQRLDDLSHLLRRLADTTFAEALAHVDEVRRPIDDRTPRQGARKLAKLIKEEPSLLGELAPAAVAQVMPKGRNFH
jgi:DNA polymerase III alpha subunit